MDPVLTHATPKQIYRQDYQPPDFSIESVELWFDVSDSQTQLRSRLQMRRLRPSAHLRLDGEGFVPNWVKVDARVLLPHEFQVDAEGLVLNPLSDEFVFETEVNLKPQTNTSLEGLYLSGKLLCTQCEAQSFRKITYFLDRPDVMSRFLVHIEASQERYPILLANGDCVERAELAGGRHRATFSDPHRKPSYLFALVAGDLGCLRDTFRTQSGKLVNLEIYAQHGQQDRCRHALDSLKNSMRWDEVRFGREYDLGTYVIVAVDDFNAGAMENKGLNIFNSKLIFADSQTATDDDEYNVESVVAHEYFHNWTGNRVTLRDWFHLSLKEGLTVFRDQEFSADMTSQGSARIRAVTALRQAQFAEDAGPNAHPILPDSCYAVDNFFTATIYEKGAEVIRMMQTLVGRPGFRKGMDLYFSRFDGQAVTIDDFATAIAEANDQDWSQFRLWYSQAGTPCIRVEEHYDPKKSEYQVKLSQTTPPTPNQNDKKPLHIPLAFTLLNANGQELPLPPSHLRDSKCSVNSEGQSLLHLTEPTQTFTFPQISERPTLSLNRFFSAPVRIDWNRPNEQLQTLATFDSDEFNRFEAIQTLALREFFSLEQAAQNTQPLKIQDGLIQVLRRALLSDLPADQKAQLLEIPNLAECVQLMPTFDVKTLTPAQKALWSGLAHGLSDEFQGVLKSGLSDSVGQRHLENRALFFLAQVDTSFEKLAWTRLQQTQNMTLASGALVALAHVGRDSQWRTLGLDYFAKKWQHEPLVLNKWFAAQAQASLLDVFEDVRLLSELPSFNWSNPNRVYSLLRVFGGNILGLYNPDQPARSWLAEKIRHLDTLNPAVATRVAASFNLATKAPKPLRHEILVLMRGLESSVLSKTTFEIVTKTRQALETVEG